jgi:hypothetical protein
MRNLRTLLLAPVAGLFVFVASACNPMGSSGATEIRLRNATGLDIDAVTVAFPAGSVEYGSISQGSSSTYQAVDSAYRYAYIDARSGDRHMVLQPIDFVGEELLEPGRYTWVLTSDPEHQYLGLELKRD